MAISLFIASLLLAILTLIPAIRSEVYWIRGPEFVRVQMMWISLSLVAAVLLFTDLLDWISRTTCLLGLLSFLYNGWFILPYLPIYPKTAAGAPGQGRANSIAVMVANVLQTNRNAAELLQIIRERDPDVIVTLESDLWWQRQLEELHPRYPHRLACPLDNLYGMHFFSRMPLSESSLEFLVQEDVPSMHTLLSMPSGHVVRIHCLHPAPPAPDENETSQPRDAELIAIAKSVASESLPVIVLGDLNDASWSATIRLFLKVSTLLDPRVGRGLFATFNAHYPFVRWPLDHVFHSPHFSVANVRRSRAFGSDHFALSVELVLDSEGTLPPAADRADGDELAIAEQKVRQESVSVSDVPSPGGETVPDDR